MGWYAEFFCYMDCIANIFIRHVTNTDLFVQRNLIILMYSDFLFLYKRNLIVSLSKPFSFWLAVKHGIPLLIVKIKKCYTNKGFM